MPLTVACVLKSGGIYDATWVTRLKAGVAKHLLIEYRFVCLSDVDVPCERIPLEHDWPGWWSKIELFKLSGPVLYFDLDTAIVGDLVEIAGWIPQTTFTMLRDFYAPGHFGSGVMGWSRDSVRRLYDIFASNPIGAMAVRRARMGDQAYIEDTWFSKPHIVCWQEACPDQIVSYKVHCRNGIPPDARVICLHGKPKFVDMLANDEVRLAWEMAA
jgi:hypothetical protein